MTVINRPQLVSRLVMLRNYFPFYEIARELEDLLGTASLFKTTSSYGSRSELADRRDQLYSKLLSRIQEVCVEHGFSHTADMAKRAAQREATTYDDIHYSLTHLNDSLTSELEGEAIFRILPAHRGYFEQVDL